MNKLRCWIEVTCLGIFLATVYELRLALQLSTGVRVALFLSVGGVLAAVLAGVLAGVASDWFWVRRLILRRRWIEGLWHVQTFDAGGLDPVANGLAHFAYVGEDEYTELKVDIHKIDDPVAGVPTRSHSLSAVLSPHSLSYVNDWEYQAGTQIHRGVAVGRFSLHGTMPYPDRYDGRLLYYDGRPYQRQIAERIPDDVVRRHQRQDPGRWRTTLLAELAQKTLR